MMKGRFAPSPSGRMHLGNVFTALISWLSARKAGGKWVLRIEDLDPQRSKLAFARLIEEDLHWLGLDWDEGGVDDKGPDAPYSQSRRSEIYETYLQKLVNPGLTYRCRCTRADIMATQAPHESDGRVVYAGTCRPCANPPFPQIPTQPPQPIQPILSPQPAQPSNPGAVRIFVPDEEITFTDRLCGPQSVNLAHHCGDFVLRRADGAWAYQLAVVVDDALMGITEVVRGNDLLLSAAQQIYLYRLLGLTPPQFMHLPLICNADGRRLSKRDTSLAMDSLRARYSPDQLIGILAHLAGIIPEPTPITPAALLPLFSPTLLPSTPTITLP